MSTAILENAIARFSYDRGILKVVVKASTVDLNVAHELIKVRHLFMKDTTCKLLIEVSGVKSVTKEARHCISGPEGTEGVIATAIVAKSNLSWMMSTFYVAANKPTIPIDVFRDEEKAFKWLSDKQIR